MYIKYLVSKLLLGHPQKTATDCYLHVIFAIGAVTCTHTPHAHIEFRSKLKILERLLLTIYRRIPILERLRCIFRFVTSDLAVKGKAKRVNEHAEPGRPRRLLPPIGAVCPQGGHLGTGPLTPLYNVFKGMLPNIEGQK